MQIVPLSLFPYKLFVPVQISWTIQVQLLIHKFPFQCNLRVSPPPPRVLWCLVSTDILQKQYRSGFNPSYLTYSSINPSFSTYSSINPSYLTYSSINPSYITYSSINPSYSTYSKILLNLLQYQSILLNLLSINPS